MMSWISVVPPKLHILTSSFVICDRLVEMDVPGYVIRADRAQGGWVGSRPSRDAASLVVARSSSRTARRALPDSGIFT
jgi:hypothetical protein